MKWLMHVSLARETMILFGRRLCTRGEASKPLCVFFRAMVVGVDDDSAPSSVGIWQILKSAFAVTLVCNTFWKLPVYKQW